MSLLSKLQRSVKKRLLPTIGGFLTGGFGGAVLGAIGAGKAPRAINGGGPIQLPAPGSMVTMQGSIAGAFPAIGGAIARQLPALGRVLPGVGGAVVTGGRAAVAGGRALLRKYPRSARALGQLGLFAAGGLVFDAAGNVVGRVGTRRMNPLNHRALRRAISRVKSAKKICAQVERIAGPRRRAAPCPPRGRKC